MKRWASIPATLLLCLTLASGVPWTGRPIGSEADSASPAVATAAAYVDSIWGSKLVPAVIGRS